MKKTLQEEKERFRQIAEHGATNMAYGFKPNEEDIKTSENEVHNDKMNNENQNLKTPHLLFGLLPIELKNKDIYTKDEVYLILQALKKKVDISANYRIYDLERFLDIFKNN